MNRHPKGDSVIVAGDMVHRRHPTVQGHSMGYATVVLCADRDGFVVVTGAREAIGDPAPDRWSLWHVGTLEVVT